MEVYKDFPVSKVSFLKAEKGYFPGIYFPETTEELKRVLEKNFSQKPIILGNCSNLLLPDEISNNYLYISLMKLKENLFLENGILEVSAGFLLGEVLSFLIGRGWGRNLLFLAGIPGSVGGAIYMNAGSGEKEEKEWIGSHVRDVAALNLENFKIESFSSESLDFSYRNSFFKMNRKYAILKVTLRVDPGNKRDLKAEFYKRIQHKINTQPLKEPSLGSVFKNSSTFKAWECIKKVFPEGFRYKSVSISDKHANFIVVKDKENYFSIHFKELVAKIQEDVKIKEGINLEREVEFLEDFYI